MKQWNKHVSALTSIFVLFESEMIKIKSKWNSEIYLWSPKYIEMKQKHKKRNEMSTLNNEKIYKYLQN